MKGRARGKPKPELTPAHGPWWTAEAKRRQQRKPVRVRRGPATVTGERAPAQHHAAPQRHGSRTPPEGKGIRADPGARRLWSPVTSNQGADPE
ncbi:hypothetical protein GCM10010357_49510 [Streptomyces luteireticuli]|uniref:Uncharacterized protein n=1 Tax=Streptomyces luteireticuli TaxID=173858 RepID=A0ABN0YZF6_9ACTN